MKKLTLLLLATLIFIVASAQEIKSTITGQVTDATTGEAIGYATIAITKSDTTVLNAIAANASGRFELSTTESSEVELQVTMVGYATTSKRIELNCTKIDVGQIALETASTNIESVVVSGVRPLIAIDAEKLIYNVESDPEAASSPLVDIMRKIPQLSVDGLGNVELNGQKSYTVLVNGRESATMSRNFKTIIEGMPAGTVKRIEVITNPSMKYSAEGAGGIINIITNRKLSGGYNGSVGVSASDRYSLGSNAYFAAQLGKLNISTSIYYNANSSRNPSTTHAEQTNLDNTKIHNIISNSR